MPFAFRTCGRVEGEQPGNCVRPLNLAAVLWLISALVPAPTRFVLWALAFAIDLGTPWAAVQHTVRVPTDAAHLPERFGLFTLILLGESVVAVLQGTESQDDWTPVAAAPCILASSFWAWAFSVW